jgi:hypothetical protein
MTSHDSLGCENARDEEDQEGSSLSTDITTKCVEVTEKFHAGTIMKVSAILALQEIILHQVETTYLEAFGAYLQVLNNFENIRESVICDETLEDCEVDGEPRGDTMTRKRTLLDQISNSACSLQDWMMEPSSRKLILALSHG